MRRSPHSIQRDRLEHEEREGQVCSIHISSMGAMGGEKIDITPGPIEFVAAEFFLGVSLPGMPNGFIAMA